MTEAQKLIITHFDDICTQTAETSIGLKHILEPYGIKRTTFIDFLNHPKNKEYSDKYARAKDMQLDTIAEEMLDIADDGSNDLMRIVKGDVEYEQENKEVVNRSKLRTDTRKWLLAKLAPRKYGDKLDVTTDGEKLPTTINIVLDKGAESFE